MAEIGGCHSNNGSIEPGIWPPWWRTPRPRRKAGAHPGRFSGMRIVEPPWGRPCGRKCTVRNTQYPRGNGHSQRAKAGGRKARETHHPPERATQRETPVRQDADVGVVNGPMPFVMSANRRTSSMRPAANGPDRRPRWHTVNWRQANRIVRHLRQRLCRAPPQGDSRKVRSLQKRMWRCHAHAWLSVRQGSQGNKGQHTPGIDKLVVQTPEARAKLVADLRAPPVAL